MRDINKYTDEYLKDGFEDYQVKYRRKKILELLAKYPHKHILEIGCGMEPLFKYLSYVEYEDYALFEPSEIFYDNAKKLSKGREKIKCVNDEFCRPSLYQLEKYDLVICSSLLHELELPNQMIKDIFGVLKSEGIVIANVPNAFSMHRLIALQANMIRDVHDASDRNKILQQNNCYDMRSFKRLFEEEFRIIDSGSYFVKPFTHAQMYQCIKNGIIDEEVLEGLYGITDYIPEYGSEIYVVAEKK